MDNAEIRFPQLFKEASPYNVHGSGCARVELAAIPSGDCRHVWVTLHPVCCVSVHVTHPESWTLSCPGGSCRTQSGPHLIHVDAARPTRLSRFCVSAAHIEGVVWRVGVWRSERDRDPDATVVSSYPCGVWKLYNVCIGVASLAAS